MRKIFALLSLILLKVNLFSQVPAFNFAKNIGGVGDDVGISVALDASGNIYTAGYFQDTVDFDPGAGTFTLSSKGGYDIFVCKTSSSGTFLWAKSFGSTLDDYSFSMEVNSSGNITIAGAFNGTADFNPGIGIYNLTSNGQSDGFILELDGSGNFVFAKTFGSTGWDDIRSMTLDGSGNIYAVGSFSGTVDFDPSTSVFNLTSAGSSDAFILKLNASGTFIWAKKVGGSQGDEGHAIKIDSGGNLIASGDFAGTVDFDPGTPAFNMTSTSTLDLFALKLDATGNFIWAKDIGGTGFAYGAAICTNSLNDIYVAGYFSATVDFDPGAGTNTLTSVNNSNDIFIVKLNSSGNFVWAKSMGGSQTDRALCIANDPQGNIYVGGFFSGQGDFDPGTNTYSLTSAGQEDIIISRLDPTGNLVWSQGIGGIGAETITSMIVNSSSNIVLTGTFEYTVDFDPGNQINNLVSEGQGDIFLYAVTQVPAGFEEINNDPKVCIYPNPSANFIHVELPSMNQSARAVIYDNSGKYLSEHYLYDKSKLDLKNYPAGIYYLSITNEEKTNTFKIVKE